MARIWVTQLVPGMYDGDAIRRYRNRINTDTITRIIEFIPTTGPATIRFVDGSDITVAESAEAIDSLWDAAE